MKNLFQKYSEAKGWTIHKNKSYGEVNGFLINSTIIQGGIYLLLPLTSISEENKKNILEYLKDKKSEFKIMEFKFSGSILYIRLKLGLGAATVYSIDFLLDNLTNFLKGIGYNSNNHCVFCGREDASEKVYVNDYTYFAHTECYEKAVASTEDTENNSKPSGGSYLTGFVGAIIGGIIFSMPWILTEVFLNKIAAVMAIIIALGAFMGYKILKGKLTGFARIIIPLATIICVLFANMASLYAELVKNSIPVNSTVINLILHSSEIMGDIERDMLLSLIMGAVGIYWVIQKINSGIKTEHPKISRAA